MFLKKADKKNFVFEKERGRRGKEKKKKKLPKMIVNETLNIHELLYHKCYALQNPKLILRIYTM